MDELQEIYNELILEFAQFSSKMTPEEQEELTETLNLIEQKAKQKNITLTMPDVGETYSWDAGSQTSVTTIATPDPASYSTSIGIEKPKRVRRKVSSMTIKVYCVRSDDGSWVQQESKPDISEYPTNDLPNVIYEDYMEVNVSEEYYDEASDSIKVNEGKYEVPCVEITEKRMTEYEKNEAKFKREYPAAYWTIKIMRWNPVFVIADNIGNEKDVLTQRKRSWEERAANIAVGVADIVTLGEGKVVVTLMYFGGKAVETGTEGTQYENLGKVTSTGMSMGTTVKGGEKLLEKAFNVPISNDAVEVLNELGTLTGTAIDLKLKEYKDSNKISEEDYNALSNMIQLGASLIPSK